MRSILFIIYICVFSRKPSGKIRFSSLSLPAGRGCTQFPPQYTVQGWSGSRPPARLPAAAPHLVAAPSWVLKQRKSDELYEIMRDLRFSR
jgi:hypothetical protein